MESSLRREYQVVIWNEDGIPFPNMLTGLHLSDGECVTLEATLRRNPRNLQIRTQLLGYHMHRRFHATDADGRRQYEKGWLRHVFWIISNAPSSRLAVEWPCRLDSKRDSEAHARACHIWRLHAGSVGADRQVLTNAAKFFGDSDFNYAEMLWNKVRDFDPDDPHWRVGLTGLYMSRISSLADASIRRRAAKAYLKRFTAMLSAGQLEAGWSGDTLLKGAWIALEAADLGTCERLANDALKTVGRSSDLPADLHHAVLHCGRTVLGRAALRRQEIGEAGRLLLASTDIPQESSFWRYHRVNMSLAKELLQCGEKAVVVQFLERNIRNIRSSLWTQPLAEWLAQLKRGMEPSFEGQLQFWTEFQ